MKEIKKPAMFVPLGRITVEGPNEVLQSVANGLNDTKNTHLKIFFTHDNPYIVKRSRHCIRIVIFLVLIGYLFGKLNSITDVMLFEFSE